MPGLNLRGSAGVVGALPASSSGTIAGLAYGQDVSTDAGAGAGRRVAGLGGITVATIAAAALVWLWWTLPD